MSSCDVIMQTRVFAPIWIHMVTCKRTAKQPWFPDEHKTQVKVIISSPLQLSAKENNLEIVSRQRNGFCLSSSRAATNPCSRLSSYCMMLPPFLCPTVQIMSKRGMEKQIRDAIGGEYYWMSKCQDFVLRVVGQGMDSVLLVRDTWRSCEWACCVDETRGGERDGRPGGTHMKKWQTPQL
jgi:hypothetical protein